MFDNIENIDNLTFENICKRISSVYNNNEKIESTNLELLFIRFIEQLFMGAFNVNIKPIVKIVEDEKCSGSHNGYITFELNRKLLQRFQEGEALELFETITHELNHFLQKKQYQNINIKNSIIEKEDYLIKTIPDYYVDNYEFVMVEVDSFLVQSKEAMDIMKVLAINPSDKEIEFSTTRNEKYSNRVLFPYRLLGTEIRDLDEIFKEKLEENSINMDEFDKSNFLEFKPCLNLEYKISNNKIIRKTVEEIEQLYKDWLNGIIQLQGLPNEIDNYFKYTIEKLNNKEVELNNKQSKF